MTNKVVVARTLRVGDFGDLWHGIRHFERDTGGQVQCNTDLLAAGLKRVSADEAVIPPEFRTRRMRNAFAPSRDVPE